MTNVAAAEERAVVVLVEDVLGDLVVEAAKQAMPSSSPSGRSAAAVLEIGSRRRDDRRDVGRLLARRGRSGSADVLVEGVVVVGHLGPLSEPVGRARTRWSRAAAWVRERVSVLASTRETCTATVRSLM